jgi:hypothetical protein
MLLNRLVEEDRALREPRRAHCRTRPFFWPMRASSWNQISIRVSVGRPSRWVLSVREKFF